MQGLCTGFRNGQRQQAALLLAIGIEEVEGAARPVQAISMVMSLPENEDVKVAPWKDRQPHRASLPGENRLDQGRGTLYMQLNLVR